MTPAFPLKGSKLRNECCRMDEAAVRVTGQYYRALSGHRDELASTSYELYTDTSVSRPSAVNSLMIGAVPVC